MDNTNETSVLMIEPPESLYSAVILRLYLEKKKSAKNRLFYTYFAISASLVAFVLALVRLSESLSSSGFYKYFSLIFSDGSALAFYWKEFALSLVESFSLPEFIILLSASLVTLVFVRMIMKNLEIINSPVQFIK